MLKEKWSNLPASKKRALVIGGVSVFIILLILFFASSSPPPPQPSSEQRQQPVVISPKGGKELLQMSVEEQQRKIQEQEAEIQKLKKRLEEKESIPLQTQTPEFSPSQMQTPEFPPPPSPPSSPSSPPPPSSVVLPPPPSIPSSPDQPPPAPKKKIVVKTSTEEEKKEGNQEGKKVLEERNQEGEKKRTVYLPSGTFVKGMLLTGGDFPASDFARQNPYPALIRLTDLAILPNDVKGNLKGCFIIAEGFGDLASERAYVRIVYLSCLDQEGRAVIDQKVKGYIADSDGKVGLRGKVVSKMGSVVVKAAMAGFIEGLGKGLSDALKSGTTLITPQGSAIQQTDETTALKAGISQGVGYAAQRLSEFYLSLAQQTVPVIEVQAVRNIFVVITEGTELEIKDVYKGLWEEEK